MTNEEKAKEYSQIQIADTVTERRIKEAYLNACEWKDQQIQEIIDKEINRANRYHDGNLSLIQKAASVRVVSVLSEYFGKEFPEDRFHFGFATMD